MRETDTHIYFWGSFLSNFWWCPFEDTCLGDTYEFKTSEHQFMFFKAKYFGDTQTAASIIEAPDAKSAKALGRKVFNFDPEAWYKISGFFMYVSCYNKFSKNEDLKERLLGTKGKILVEASPIDNIWGVGLHETDDLILDSKNWKGENRLGDVLMVVRDNLEKEQANDERGTV